MSYKYLLKLCLALGLSPMLVGAAEPASSGTTPGDRVARLGSGEKVTTDRLTRVEVSDLAFEGDTIRILNNGGMLNYEVSKNEFFFKDKMTGEANIESLATGFATAEEMRNFVREEDGVWGQQCMMVLYKAGMPKTDENRCLLTHKIEVKMDPEFASMELLSELAAAVGVEVGSKSIGQSGSGWLLATCGGSAVKVAEILAQHEKVLRARPITTIPLVKQNINNLPNDQFYNVTDQFYLHHQYLPFDRIEVWQVWCGGAPDQGWPELQERYFGRNVSISLLDDGIQGDHPEIDRAYNFGDDTDFVDGDNDGGPANFQDNHGTQMAGIMVARQNNGIGIAGIAPAAEIFSVRVFGADSDPQVLADAHEHEASTVDVVVSGFVPGGNYVDISETLDDALHNMAERKDVAITYPAGDSAGAGARNDYDRLSSHRYTIAVGAFGSPSEPGCNIITTGPGDPTMATTDRTGEDGDSDTDYMFEFGGTSGANACMGGILALIKDARPDLGWRDYQEIMLLTGFRWNPIIFPPNGAGVNTPLGPFGFAHNYTYGGGFMEGVTAVALAEVWAPLPSSAALYRTVSRRNLIREDIGVTDILRNADGTFTLTNPQQTFFFDFNRVVPSLQNLRIEHLEVRVEWEEPPNGSPADLLPTYLRLVDPYYTVGPNGFNPYNRPDEDQGRLAHASILSTREGNIGSPVEWTYTTNRHWGLVNTGGFNRVGVPGKRSTEVVEPGVWELDVSVEPFIANDNPLDPSSRLTRRLIEVEVTMYGTENNVPPTVVSARITSSANSTVPSPRTAFEDEDLLVDDVVFFDPEGDALTVGYQWQELDEDGLTWNNVGNLEFGSGDCEYDEFAKVVARADLAGNTYGRYFIVYKPDGTSVAYWFQQPGSTIAPAGALAADMNFPIPGVTLNEGAVGISTDIRDAVIASGQFAGSVIFDPVSETPDWLVPGEVAILYGPMTGDVQDPESGTSNLVVTREVSQDPAGNCFGSTSARLDASETRAGTQYRVVIIPRDGLREGFRFTSDPIIVNSRPVYTGIHNFPYTYDANLWILTVPPEDLAPFAFVNELSQGTGDGTTNQEWVELLVNYTTDMRGFRLSNDIASFDLTFTQSEVWEEVPFGTIIVIYNGEQKDPLIPADTLASEFSTSTRWIISSGNPALFTLPANGDGWGEFSNIDCTPEEATCDGAHVSLLTQFGARNPIHGVSINGNGSFVDAGVARAGEAVFFDGLGLLPIEGTSPTDPDGWVFETAADATPGEVNSPNNQMVLAQINFEAKTSVPTYRFYPGDGSQVIIDPMTGFPTGAGPDLVASDIVPGLTIDRKTGLISGIPDVPGGGTFTIKIQRFHSFSSEIQIYELVIAARPPLVDSEDDDGDGLINLLEVALGADPYSAQANMLPTGQIVGVAAFTFPSISFRRLAGGVYDAATGTYTFDDLVYTIEASTDLQTWLTAPDIVPIQFSVVDSVDQPGVVEVATFRAMDTIGSGLLGNRYYLRLRVTRL